jgi:hypothetical protein
MQPKEEVVRIDSGRDRYDGGGGPEKYVGASERSPMESSRMRPAAAVDGRVLSALRAVRMNIAWRRRSKTLSVLPGRTLAGVPIRDGIRDCWSIDSSALARVEGSRVDGRLSGRRKDLDRDMSKGAGASRTSS